VVSVLDVYDDLYIIVSKNLISKKKSKLTPVGAKHDGPHPTLIAFYLSSSSFVVACVLEWWSGGGIKAAVAIDCEVVGPGRTSRDCLT